MEEKKVLTTIEEAKVICDPFRYRILSTFNKINRPATVKEIASAMDEVPANVHYHVRKLEASGILKLVYTKEIKGILAKYYEPTAKNFEIDTSSEMDTIGKELILAEGQRILAQFYDISKNIVIEQLSFLPEHNRNKLGTLCMEDIYLDDEEARAFREYIHAFIDKHRKCPDSTPGPGRHHIFVSLYKMLNEK